MVRALCHHRQLAAPRLPAVVVGDVPPDADGVRLAYWQLRPVLHALPPVLPLSADGRHGRSQVSDATRGGPLNVNRRTSQARGRSGN